MRNVWSCVKEPMNSMSAIRAYYTVSMCTHMLLDYITDISEFRARFHYRMKLLDIIT